MAMATQLIVLSCCLLAAASGSSNQVVEAALEDDTTSPDEALMLLQHSASWFELPRTSSGVEGFCDVELNATSWDCGKISAATDCASKTGCSWSAGDPFPGLCGVRDDPAQELHCKKLTRPTDCVSASCQWYRFAMGPGPVRWSR
eukprot:Skav232233  [mRNA]  locus=scaffold4367:115152:116542:- [translate_table: standard]